jgi:hypothetical protein
MILRNVLVRFEHVSQHQDRRNLPGSYNRWNRHGEDGHVLLRQTLLVFFWARSRSRMSRWVNPSGFCGYPKSLRTSSRPSHSIQPQVLWKWIVKCNRDGRSISEWWRRLMKRQGCRAAKTLHTRAHIRVASQLHEDTTSLPSLSRIRCFPLLGFHGNDAGERGPDGIGVQFGC